MGRTLGIEGRKGSVCGSPGGGGAVCYGSFQRWAEVYGRAVGREQEAPADHVMPSTEWGAGGEKSGAPLRSLFRQMRERPMRINVEKSAKRYEGGGRAS